MGDESAIVGIVLMTLGGVFVAGGLLLCYLTKGEYYNSEEVQAMVAAEVMEEEKKKRLAALETEAQIKDELQMEKNDPSSSGAAAAFALEGRLDSARSSNRSRPGTAGSTNSAFDGFGELGAAAPVHDAPKKKRRAPLMAA